MALDSAAPLPARAELGWLGRRRWPGQIGCLGRFGWLGRRRWPGQLGCLGRFGWLGSSDGGRVRIR
jgi:hypothetical protein